MMRFIPLALVITLMTAFAQAAEPIAVKVLYAGNPGSEREADFVEFLQKNFAKVGKCALPDFTPADAIDYDVVIFDWTAVLKHKPDGTLDEKTPMLEMPPLPKVDDSY